MVFRQKPEDASHRKRKPRSKRLRIGQRAAIKRARNSYFLAEPPSIRSDYHGNNSGGDDAPEDALY